jgi:hypothetical protein
MTEFSSNPNRFDPSNLCCTDMFKISAQAYFSSMMLVNTRASREIKTELPSDAQIGLLCIPDTLARGRYLHKTRPCIFNSSTKYTLPVITQPRKA